VGAVYTQYKIKFPKLLPDSTSPSMNSQAKKNSEYNKNASYG
jgi:hypothetical protein